MKKSASIALILENLEELNYDESFSELDRDRLRLKYAKAYLNEVTALSHHLSRNPKQLPNHKDVPSSKQESYYRILKLLASNVDYLNQVIQSEQSHLISKSLQNTKQSCIQCHTAFKSF